MNLLTELQKEYPDNNISIKERFIKDIRTIDDPEFKPESKEDKTKPPKIEQDNSLHTYNIVFDEVETDAQMFYNIVYSDGEHYDLINSVGKHSVAMMIRKINEWRKSEIEKENETQLAEDIDKVIMEGISH